MDLPRAIMLVYSEKLPYQVAAGWVPQDTDSETETSQCSWGPSLETAAGLGREKLDSDKS